MEELREDVLKAADERYQQYLADGRKDPSYPPYKASGCLLYTSHWPFLDRAAAHRRGFRDRNPEKSGRGRSRTPADGSHQNPPRAPGELPRAHRPPPDRNSSQSFRLPRRGEIYNKGHSDSALGENIPKETSRFASSALPSGRPPPKKNRNSGSPAPAPEFPDLRRSQPRCKKIPAKTFRFGPGARTFRRDSRSGSAPAPGRPAPPPHIPPEKRVRCV